MWHVHPGQEEKMPGRCAFSLAGGEAEKFVYLNYGKNSTK